jgi:hypothetical protein
MVNLINATLEKMKGFEQSATQKYYESICDKAWGQVKAAGTPDEASVPAGEEQ